MTNEFDVEAFRFVERLSEKEIKNGEIPKLTDTAHTLESCVQTQVIVQLKQMSPKQYRRLNYVPKNGYYGTFAYQFRNGKFIPNGIP